MSFDLVNEICLALNSAAVFFKRDLGAHHVWEIWTHQQVANVAARYARSLGIGFGKVADMRPDQDCLSICTADGSLPAAEHGKFMFSQAWLTRRGYDYLTSLDFVMETELNPDMQAITGALAKLLIAKANYKLIVCVAYDCETRDEIVGALSSQIQAFRRADEGAESYIFSVYCYDEAKFRHFLQRNREYAAPFTPAD